jgi:hypothetical protein
VTLKIKLDANAATILKAMSREASLPVEDLAEIAVYNLIGLWIRDKGEVTEGDAVANCACAGDMPGRQCCNDDPPKAV